MAETLPWADVNLPGRDGKATAVPPAEAQGVRIRGGRLPAVDWMRGLMMVFMLVSHSSSLWNAGHLSIDSAGIYKPGMEIPVDQFLNRLASYLTGGPATFLLTGGAAIAFYIAKNLPKGERAIDRFLLTRGALLAVLDPTLITWYWEGPPPRFLQVLFATGCSMMALTLLRRLSSRWLLAISLSIMVFGEAVALLFWSGKAWNAPLPLALLLGVTYSKGWLVLYPVLPWLAVMTVGFVCGRKLSELRESGRPPERLFLAWGLALLAAFLLIRGLNGYGNMLLYREDLSWIQWLHVSKYPPSLAYMLMSLGMAALCFTMLLYHQRSLKGEPWRTNPLLVFGRTPFFFYLVHWPVLIALGKIGGVEKGGLREACLIALLGLIILYPLCFLYGRYKSKTTAAWVSYL